MDNNCYISIEGLTYCYPGGGKVLRDIHAEIAAGEVVFICGESGSGKTTLGKCMTGAVPGFYGGTVDGAVKINGKEISSMTHSERASEITMVFQDPERQLMMGRVHREIAFGLENVGIDPAAIKRRVWESMQFCNILDLWDREIRTLSGGQKQKVAVAAAIACMPKCIIFDEPTSQLDPLSAEEIISLIAKINRELGITSVIIEQRTERCFEICDKLMLLENGTVSFYGSREEFYGISGDGFSGYMPVHLRLAKLAGEQVMPASVKETRKLMVSRAGQALACSTAPVNGVVQKSKTEELLTVRNLSVSYGSKPVLNGINISASRGDFVGILGPNGSGKSTFLKSLTGLLKYSGSVKVGGKEVSRLKSGEAGRLMGYISQNPNDYISKDTVFEELKFTLDNYGKTDVSVIDDVLRTLGIEGLRDKNPRDLSGGEKQRVAIASVLVNKPDILLLDEPTRGLDSGLKLQLGKLLSKLKDEGVAVLLVTHDIEFASEFCSSFIMLFSGEIISSGARDEVMKDGLYYTTAANKIFREIAADVYTLGQAKEWLESNVG